MVGREPSPPNPDYAETAKRFLMEMPISRHLGFAITDLGPGLFEITQPFREELSFKPGIFQAGPVGTLADMAAACAGMTMLPRGWAASTVDYTIKACRARVRREARRAGPAGEVWSDVVRRCLRCLRGAPGR